ncbi:FAD/NAD(P)-binding protein [uncultured Cytophaga sp.]|uniref:FAD/NAD(P)-binding protein n=1 Tax=uncultured Cytophaga sp. TaxID=160238 RepID=UPI0026319539|nr:FAD/NAD(P)-binding protein [uncultured Cytophaga sp.]
MNSSNVITKIALIGGGPSALYVCKNLISSASTNIELHIFEKSDTLGAGMPYSIIGANDEHITNVSDNEIPELLSPIHDWVKEAPLELLNHFNIDPTTFNEYKVLPRLFFGRYLSAQFEKVIALAKTKGIAVHVYLNHKVVDIEDVQTRNEVIVSTEEDKKRTFNRCIICTGHYWPKTLEGNIPNYYDSPYPPSKLERTFNHPVAIRGSSLTAIDVIRTLAAAHGRFEKNDTGEVCYIRSETFEDFRMVLHSRNGLLPAVRIHLEESQASSHNLIHPDQVLENRKTNNGFLSLDFVFEMAFKDAIKEKDPDFYARIQHKTMEDFVQLMMRYRLRLNPFSLFEKECVEADISIHTHKPIFWKEILAALSYAMNYPAKYFSAEDMLRIQHTLSELIANIIAFVPQDSAREILALHKAGVLDLIRVDRKSTVEPVQTGGAVYSYMDTNGNRQCQNYKTFINAFGQAHFPIEVFPFKSLNKKETISQATLKFKDVYAAETEISKGNKDVHKNRDGTYSLYVSGIAINDFFQVVDQNGIGNKRVYIMAVPFISGYNPDYSGLDFCERASSVITETILTID